MDLQDIKEELEATKVALNVARIDYDKLADTYRMDIRRYESDIKELRVQVEMLRNMIKGIIEYD